MYVWVGNLNLTFMGFSSTVITTREERPLHIRYQSRIKEMSKKLIHMTQRVFVRDRQTYRQTDI